MFKHACVLGVILASVGSLALSQSGGGASHPATPEPANFPRVETAAALPADTVPTDSISASEDATLVRSLGLSVTSVPAALTAHLGLEANTGLLVTAVEAGSRAAAAGLEPFDVIVAIDARPAQISALEAAQEGEPGLALDVIRAGIEARIGVPAANAPVGFLSTDHLGPDHPFRRMAELGELKESYSKKAEDYSQRMRRLDEEARAAREEAKRQVAVLQGECDEQVAAYLAERQVELLALLDAHINEAAVAPLAELAIDLEALVPAERVAATNEVLQQVNELVRQGLTERLELTGPGSEEQAKRARSRFDQVQNEVGNLLAERVRRPWEQDVECVDPHRQRLSQQYQERMQWTAKTVAEIHTQVHDRITCAIERTQEEFSKQLRKRLSAMEVPQPGEIEAVLADMQAQIETMTERFIRRTELALGRYVVELQEGNDELVAGLQSHFPACEAAAVELDDTIRGVVAETLEAQPLVIDDGWQTRARVDQRYDDLRAALRNAVNDGRNAMRVGSVGLATDLDEHKVASEDAWRDLRQLLGEIASQAKSDCWKLEGPYLDGRFPKAPAPTEDERPKGEVVMR